MVLVWENFSLGTKCDSRFEQTTYALKVTESQDV